MVLTSWGLFCHMLTGVNVEVSRSLKGESSWLCLLWHQKSVPGAVDAETYSYHLFGTAEKSSKRQGRLGSAGESHS